MKDFKLKNCKKVFIVLFLIVHVGNAKLNGRRKLLRRRQQSQHSHQNETLDYRHRILDHNVQETMVLKFYKNNTKTIERSAFYNGNMLENTGCSSYDKFYFILHGWIQSCSDDWALALIDRVSYYRGGCVVCIDYSVIASSSYMRLYIHFDIITDAIVATLKSLSRDGFDINQSYMFGFSFGGQLASAVGRSLGAKYGFRNVDTCDMAGPGFDPIAVDHSRAAKHVQCFHSSRDKGTFIYACHKNIMLGSCGQSQPSVASQRHLGSHGLCLDIYINTFDYPFYALINPPPECLSFSKPAKIPNDYTVGYEENFDKHILGKIFVPTSLHYPYNLSKRELKLIYKDNS